MNDLKSELSGNLEDCLLALLEPSTLYDAKCLRRAMRVSIVVVHTCASHVVTTKVNTDFNR